LAKQEAVPGNMFRRKPWSKAQFDYHTSRSNDYHNSYEQLVLISAHLTSHLAATPMTASASNLIE